MTINLDTVASVYSGKAGRCCCGCSGKHTYASAHREWAGKNRGYAVDDDDVNDVVVKRLVNKLSKLPVTELDIDNDYISYESPTGRLYVVYLKS